MSNSWLPPSEPNVPVDLAPIVLDSTGTGPTYVTPTAKKSHGRLLGALAAGVLLVGGVGTALAMRKGASGGGATTPEAAVQGFFDSVEAGDWLGALEGLPKGERQLFVQMMETSLAEGKRLGLTAEGASLRNVSGLKIDFQNVTLKSSPVNDRIARVEITGGTMVTDVTVADLPIGDLLRKVMDKNDVDMSDQHNESTIDDDDDDVIAAIKDDEGWHLSLMHSIGEAARGNEPMPDSIAAAGADSPAEAVEQFLRAAVKLDAARAIALIDPEEGLAFHDYGQLAVDAIADLDVRPRDLPKIDELSLTSTKGPSGTTVTIKKAAISMNLGGDDQQIVIEREGSCTTMTTTFEGESDTQKVCPDDLKDLTPADLGPDSDPIEAGFSLLGEFASRAQSQLADNGIVTHEVGGKWYIAPGSTIVSLVFRFSAIFERADLERLLNG